MVEVFHKTMSRLYGGTDLQRHRGMHAPLQRCRDRARDALVAFACGTVVFCGGCVKQRIYS
jgi:hypothetical protein